MLTLPEGSAALTATLAKARRTTLRPPPKFDLVEWADEYRRVPSKSSATPGKWRTARQPCAIGPMRAVTTPGVHVVTVVAGTQVLKSELLINTAFYFIHQDPSPILFVQPSQKAAESFSKERIQPSIAETPVLRDLVKPPKARGSENTITHKDYPGGSLDFVGSESPTDLASRPKRVILCDEINKYPISAGKEGDPLFLAEERASTYQDVLRHLYVRVCSPTEKGRSRISAEYAKSDQRRCFVPCPDCGHRQQITWARVHWLKVLEDGTETFDPPEKATVVRHRPETAQFSCEECGTLWTEDQRREALAALVDLPDAGWRQTARFTCCGEEQTPDAWDDAGRSLCAHCGERSPFDGHAGFHAPKLISRRHRLSAVVKEFLDAGRDPEALQKWTNTALAEDWEHLPGDGLDGAGLIHRRELYGPEDLPEGVRTITGFCDVQGDRLEVQGIGWGHNEEAWPALYEVIPIDPTLPEAWRELDAIRGQTFTTRDGRKLRFAAFGVDVGGQHHSALAWDYCRRRKNQRVFATIGRPGKHPIWPTLASTSRAKDTFWFIGADAAKDQVYARLRIEPDPMPTDGSDPKPKPGLIHFPKDDERFGETYFAQLTAERRETRRRLGQTVTVWVNPPGRRNEALDTFVGCLAVRRSLPRRIEQSLQYEGEATAPRPRPAPSPRPTTSPTLRLPAAPAPAVPPPRRPGAKHRPGRPLAVVDDPYL